MAEIIQTLPEYQFSDVCNYMHPCPTLFPSQPNPTVLVPSLYWQSAVRSIHRFFDGT